MAKKFKDMAEVQKHINNILADLSLAANKRPSGSPKGKKPKNATDQKLIFFDRQNSCCNYCYVEYSSSTGVGDFDHITPPFLYEGEDVNMMSNIQWLCKACHTAKTKLENQYSLNNKKIRKILNLPQSKNKIPSIKNKIPSIKNKNEIVLTLEKNRSIIKNPKFEIYDDDYEKWSKAKIYLRGRIDGEADFLRIGNDSRIKNNHNSNNIRINKKGTVLDKIEYDLDYEGWTTVDEAYLAYEDDWGDYEILVLGKNAKIVK